MKKIDTAQSNIQMLWLETSRLVDGPEIVASTRVFQSLYQELVSFKSTDDIALLDLMRDEYVVLNSTQQHQLGENAANARKVLKAIVNGVKEMDAILTHMLMGLQDYDPQLDKLLDKIIASAEARLAQLQKTQPPPPPTESLLRYSFISELMELLDYCKLISSELKNADVTKEADQRLLVTLAIILAFTKKQIERPNIILAPLTILLENTKAQQTTEFLNKIQQVKLRSKLILAWLYQKFKTQSLILTSPYIPLSSDELIMLGTQIRNIRLAFSYIQVKKTQNEKRKLHVSDARLTKRLLQASTDKDKNLINEKYSVDDF